MGGGRRAAEGADEEGPGDGQVDRPQARAISAGLHARPKRPTTTLPEGGALRRARRGRPHGHGRREVTRLQARTGGVFVTVGSTAHIYRTLGDANTSWRRGTSTQTLTCLADIVRLSAAPGQKITIVSSKRVAFPRSRRRRARTGSSSRSRPPGTSGSAPTSTRSSSSAGGSSRSSLFTSLGRPIADGGAHGARGGGRGQDGAKAAPERARRPDDPRSRARPPNGWGLPVRRRRHRGGWIVDGPGARLRARRAAPGRCCLAVIAGVGRAPPGTPDERGDDGGWRAPRRGARQGTATSAATRTRSRRAPARPAQRRAGRARWRASRPSGGSPAATSGRSTAWSRRSRTGCDAPVRVGRGARPARAASRAAVARRCSATRATPSASTRCGCSPGTRPWPSVTCPTMTRDARPESVRRRSRRCARRRSGEALRCALELLDDPHPLVRAHAVRTAGAVAGAALRAVRRARCSATIVVGSRRRAGGARRRRMRRRRRRCSRRSRTTTVDVRGGAALVLQDIGVVDDARRRASTGQLERILDAGGGRLRARRPSARGDGRRSAPGAPLAGAGVMLETGLRTSVLACAVYLARSSTACTSG